MVLMFYYAVVLALFLLIFAIIFLFIFKKTHDKALGLWGTSFGFYGLGILVQILLIDILPESDVLTFQQIVFALSALFLLSGTYYFTNKTVPRFWFFLLLISLFWLFAAAGMRFPYYIEVLPLSLFYSVVAVYTGIEFLQHWPIEGPEKSITGIIFIIWGIHKSYYFYLNPDFNSSSMHYMLELILVSALNIAIFFVYMQKNSHTLKRNEKIFRLLTENSKDIIYLYTMKPEPRFEYISPNITAILGYAQNDFYNNPYLLFECVHPDDKPLFDLSIMPNLSPDASVEIRYLTRTGEYRWFQEYTTLIHDPSGEPFGVEGRMQDITELKKYSDSRKSSEKDRQKLLYMVSHELKTPITTLRGNLEAILDNKIPDDPESMNACISNAYHKTLLLERLVSDLFELSQFESNQFSFKFSLLSFEEAFLPIFEKFTRDLVQAGYRYALHISEDIDRENTLFMLDVERIDQVMYNLISNAMKNTPKDGTISIDCSVPDKGHILIRVSDTGCGIAAKDLPHIFEMFYTSADPKTRGSGLGLAIAGEILAKHHAEISVESKTGQGSIFTIKFPVFLD